MGVKVDWIDVNDAWPQEPGQYLTYWTDGALETFYFLEEEIAEGQITLGNAKLIFWAENVLPPEGFES